MSQQGQGGKGDKQSSGQQGGSGSQQGGQTGEINPLKIEQKDGTDADQLPIDSDGDEI